MNNKRFHDLLWILFACGDAQNWVRNNKLSAKQAWRKCTNPSWSLWLLLQLGIRSNKYSGKIALREMKRLYEFLDKRDLKDEARYVRRILDGEAGGGYINHAFDWLAIDGAEVIEDGMDTNAGALGRVLECYESVGASGEMRRVSRRLLRKLCTNKRHKWKRIRKAIRKKRKAIK